MVTKAEYAEWVGREDATLTEAEFENLLRKGKARLERALGYQLCPLTIESCPPVETTQEYLDSIPEVSFPYKSWQQTIEVPPFIELYSVIMTSCEGDDQVLEECDYLVRKGDYFADWAKEIQLCNPCLKRCAHCVEVRIKALWGLCCKIEESEPVCCIPDELKSVLMDMMAENDSCDKSNIKKESALSYSYEKFDKVDLLTEYQDILYKYAIGKPNHYPL